jgi:hypothetical protein
MILAKMEAIFVFQAMLGLSNFPAKMEQLDKPNFRGFLPKFPFPNKNGASRFAPFC